MIFRLIATFFSLLLAVPALGASHGSRGTGTINLGLNGISASSLIYPFIDIWKSASRLQVNVSGTNYFTDSVPGSATSAWQFLDANGDLLPNISGLSFVIRIFYATPGTFPLPAGCCRTGQAWVLTWTGTATATISSGGGSSSNGRLAFTWPTDSINLQVNFNSITNSDPPKNIHIFLAASETAFNAGALFDPLWQQTVRAGSGVVRFMDWMSTNNNFSTLRYSQIPTESYFSWGQSYPALQGMPVSIMAKLANAVYSHPWVNIPELFGTKSSVKVTAITNANPAVATTDQAHTLTTGDQVIAYSGTEIQKDTTVTFTTGTPCVVNHIAHGWSASTPVTFSNSGGALPTGVNTANANLTPAYFVTSPATDTYQIATTPGGAAIACSGSPSGTQTEHQYLLRSKFTVGATTSTTFELAGYDTTSFSAFSGSGTFFSSPIDISLVTPEVASLAAFFRDNVASGLNTFFEPGNELWNPTFQSIAWLFSQARWSGLAGAAGDNSTFMSGYLGAHMMKTVRDTYGIAARGRWKGILGTQTVNTGVTSGAISGINAYIVANAPTLVVSDLFDYVAMTGYFGDAFEGNSGSVSATFNVGASTVTAAGLINGQPEKVATSGTLPTPLDTSTIYYTVGCVGTACQLALASGGSPITLGGSPSGAATTTKVRADVTRKIMNDSTAFWQNGSEQTKYSYFNRSINQDNLDGRFTGNDQNVSNLATFWNAQKTIATANSLGIIQYEGNNNNGLLGPGMSGDSQYLEFFPNCFQTPEDAANYTAMFNNWAGVGGVFPSKFVEAAAITIFGQYGGQYYIGWGGPVWNAVTGFNSR